jgi:glutamate-5-semialdehyde dehydrogenase
MAPPMPENLEALVTAIAMRARAASLALAVTGTKERNAALADLADRIDRSHSALGEANQRDLAAAGANGLGAADVDRLTLTPARLAHLAESVRQVAALPDPLGEVLEDTVRPNGLHMRKVRVPIGVIGVIFEARPNVAVDCAVLCLKSGNASILRGGREIFETNTAFAGLIAESLEAAGLPRDAVQFIPTTDRAALEVLLRLDTLVHCIIPRGGEGLIRFVSEHSTIPVIKHYTGVCFVYLDKSADPAMAESIVVNAKTQRPGVCNAAEQLLVHGDAAATLLPRVGAALAAKGVRLLADDASARVLKAAGIASEPATPGDFRREFLDLVAAVRIVPSLGEAVATINRDGSAHSDAIVTADKAAADTFLASVDSAVVLWNASTRFNDGFEFGFGAEIGISTDRLHARGPMGLRELCSYKWLVTGTGQVRG